MQVPLADVLAKFDGETYTDVVLKKIRKRFRITALPRYLILHIKRFTKNNWFKVCRFGVWHVFAIGFGMSLHHRCEHAATV